MKLYNFTPGILLQPFSAAAPPPINPAKHLTMFIIHLSSHKMNMYSSEQKDNQRYYSMKTITRTATSG